MSIYLRASVNLSIRASNQLLSSLMVSRNVSVLPGKVRGSFCLKGIHLSLESCLTDFLNYIKQSRFPPDQYGGRHRCWCLPINTEGICYFLVKSKFYALLSYTDLNIRILLFVHLWSGGKSQMRATVLNAMWWVKVKLQGSGFFQSSLNVPMAFCLRVACIWALSATVEMQICKC